MISLIAATAAYGVIGHNGKLPWIIPADLKRFAQLTRNRTLIMGRKTYDSLPKKVFESKGRCYVISRESQPVDTPANVTFVDNYHVILDFVDNKNHEIFVIGGEDIYRLFLNYAKKIYLTQIDAVYDGDTFFPHLDPSDWKVKKITDIKNEPNLPKIKFQELTRV